MKERYPKKASRMNYWEYGLKQPRMVLLSRQRLELTTGKFEVPHYVILKRTFDEGEEYTVHRHTIPSFIALSGLSEEFLGRSVTGLEQFAVAIHRQLVSLSNRTDTVTRLKSLKGLDTLSADEAVRLIELATNQWMAKIVLMDKGERCVVINNEGERMKDLEQKILGMGNNETDLVARVEQIL
jgi:Cenp-O kinetochore centromere component